MGEFECPVCHEKIEVGEIDGCGSHLSPSGEKHVVCWDLCCGARMWEGQFDKRCFEQCEGDVVIHLWGVYGSTTRIYHRKDYT